MKIGNKQGSLMPDRGLLHPGWLGWVHVCCRVLRSLPFQKGKLRLARWLLAPVPSGRDVQVSDAYGNSLLFPSVSEMITQQTIAYGVYEGSLVEYIAKLVEPGDVVIDAGANVGSVALAIARAAPCHVLAVEADPAIAAYLAKNVERNRGAFLVEVVCGLLSDSDGDMVPFYPAPATSFGMGSRAPQFSSGGAMLETSRLDTLCEERGVKRVCVVKLDVEGFEWEVLRGFVRALTGPTPPTVVFEFCDWAEARMGRVGAAQEYLVSLGFRLQLLGERGELIDFSAGEIMRHGFATLVATRPGLAPAFRGGGAEE